MNALPAGQIPMLMGLCLLGIALGAAANAGIYSLAWFCRPISPWQRRHPGAAARQWSDYLPIYGWLGLRRESPLHGRGFWIRPLLLELACGIGLPALYVWEITGHLAPPLAAILPPSTAMRHHEFISHAVLMFLMLVATFIDFDEKTIPDQITIPGTLAGLLLAIVWPDSHLPVPRLLAYGPLLLTSTHLWPAWLNGWRGLLLGLAIAAGWCVALIPAVCTLRRGWQKAIEFYFASIVRHATWWKMLIVAVLCAALVIITWRMGAARWQALLTALVGLATGGGLVWAVRIVGRVALRKEAMGFGDVTLMAMIGAFLGWQACLMIFFLSPFAALVIALVQWALTGRRDIPYGPYLCAAAVAVVVGWAWFWNQFGPLFGLGWLLPAVLSACLLLMMGLLISWRLIEEWLFRGDGE